ncbi:MAG TPA: hypothetical protein VMN58_11145 [Acidimicrobiales bacterium]|nr:hypothetical protein [Acidimicrobiales bacterium]
MSGSEEPRTFFPYRFDMRYAPLWAPLAAWPGRDGVTLTDEDFRATFGMLKLETTRDNVIGGHVTEGYRWYKAIGARLSRVDDGLTFGTNAERGVCVHFRDRVPRVIGFTPHSALTVTVTDCAGLVEVIGETTPRTSSGDAGSDG